MGQMRRTSNRTPIKQSKIADALRQQIVDGTIPPGGRLPLREQLQERFDVSSATLQSALTRLMQDGFVQSQGRSGTFVVDHPPHLNRYAIAFSNPPKNTGVRSRFWASLSELATALDAEEDPHRFPIYYGIDGHMDTEACQLLYADMKNQRLAGVIYPFIRWQDADHSPLTEQPPAPTVVITTEPDQWRGPTIVPDMGALIDRALDELKERGRKRVALLTTSNGLPQWYEQFLTGVASRGMETRPYWMQCVAWPEIHWGHNIAELLMQSTHKDRPDGLIILDDNIAEHVVAGLSAAGVRGPQDVEIIAHTNFPTPSNSILPMRRMGFDVRQFLDSAISLINDARRGKKTPHVTHIAPVLENEVEVAT